MLFEYVSRNPRTRKKNEQSAPGCFNIFSKISVVMHGKMYDSGSKKRRRGWLSEGQCGGRPGVATEEYGLKNGWEGAGKVSGEQACRVLAVARDKEGWGPWTRPKQLG